MPINSLIVGVDLAPIKSIPKAITFQGDITSDKCRATIRQHFKTWKADTVLHDGAPNVGTAWVQDAFSQAELALQALKLASEFLIEGGTFVTKVFRSKDYNALLWVCNQLFSKVEATKPPSSRNVSAEIFVVCRGFKAPKRIDPRLLEPRSVFAELANPTPNHEAKVFNPEKKKRKREGYEEGDYTQFRKAPASEFVQTSDPIAMLGSLNQLHFAQTGEDDLALAALDQLPETTIEIRQCCNDLKVLGRKEFRMLLRWRSKARERFGLATKKKKPILESEEVAEITPMDEELRLQEDLQTLNDNQEVRKKREKRRVNEKKQKDIVRMQMNMLPPTEIGLEQAGPSGEDSMFTLAAVGRAGALESVSRGTMGTVVQKVSHSDDATQSDSATDDEEDGLESDLDALYQRYQQRRSDTDAKFRAKKARAEHGDGEWTGISESAVSSDEDVEIDRSSTASSDLSDDGGLAARTSAHKIGNSGLARRPLTQRAALFFDQDVFKDVGLLHLGESEDGRNQTSNWDASSDPGRKTGDTAETPSRPSAQFEAHNSSLDIDARSDSSSVTLTLKSSSPTSPSKMQPHAPLDNDSSKTIQQERKKEMEVQPEPQKNGRLGKIPQ